MNIAPCKDCPDRVLSCHSVCEKYKLFQSINTELNESKYAANSTKVDFIDHMQLSKRRMRQNRGNFKNTTK
jgi:hypothetical protein